MSDRRLDGQQTRFVPPPPPNAAWRAWHYRGMWDLNCQFNCMLRLRECLTHVHAFQIYANGLRFTLMFVGGMVAVWASKFIGYPSAGALGCIQIAFIAGIGWRRRTAKVQRRCGTDMPTTATAMDGNNSATSAEYVSNRIKDREGRRWCSGFLSSL